MLGSTCLQMMRISLMPRARAPWMKSRSRNEMAEPRAIRANLGVMAMAMAMERFTIPEPRTASTISPRIVVGKVISRSVNRTVTASMTPPL